MTPVQFLLEHRDAVLSAFEGSGKKTWSTLSIQLPEITNVMALNSFRVLIRPFVETCRFFDDRLNKLNIKIDELNKTVNGLNEKLNTEHELNIRLNIFDGLNSELNIEAEQVKQKLNIAGWTVAKSGGYFRAFKKIKGRVYGVHLGRNLANAEAKIDAKRLQIQGNTAIER
jgi:hypothetical protein